MEATPLWREWLLVILFFFFTGALLLVALRGYNCNCPPCANQGAAPPSPAASQAAPTHPDVSLHTMKNPGDAHPPFEWGAPMPLLPADQARSYLKEERGHRWLPQHIRDQLRPREKPVRVVSVFPLDCELDLLEVKLMELYDVVDYFVIGEANYSQVGVAKRLHFWESRHRFQRFWPKIRHMVYWEGFKREVDRNEWTNEKLTRAWLDKGLRGLDDDDIVILTDADEFPNRDAILFYRHYTGYPEQGRLFVRWSQMGFFWQVTRGVWGPLQSVATYRVAKKIGMNGIRSADQSVGEWWTLGSESAIAGWHCSWCFPSQDFRNKFRNVIEPFWNSGSKIPEYSDELLAKARYEGTTIGDPPFSMNLENHPGAVKEHFKFLADREVKPRCGWCRLPAGDTYPIADISPDDPLPDDLLRLRQECSNNDQATRTRRSFFS